MIATDYLTHTSLDINVNCLSGLYNTLFLYHHGRRSPDLFLPLAHLIKAWSKKRVCPHSTDSSTKVTSYSLMIMLLAYLASIGAVRDLLVQSQPREPGWISERLRVVNRQGRVLHYMQEFSTGGGIESSRVRCVDALYGFFGWIVEWEPNVSREVVSMRASDDGRMSKREADFERTSAYMVVVDPFLTDRNITASLSNLTAQRFFQVRSAWSKTSTRGAD